MRKLIAALLVLALPWAASAQVVTSGSGPSVMVTGTNASGATVTLPVPASITVGINGVVSGGGGTPTGPAGTPNINVVTVQGIAGATPIPITGTISASTSGTATTAAPTYVNNTSNPLSLNLAGGMRVDGSGVTQPVSGTFFQGTQPVSGTFFQGTQPVSIATMPSTPVTGTFFQGTQPVSLATAPTTPVTGTFFQGTQPVSIATMPSTPVTGTFFQGTQPVSMASAATQTDYNTGSVSLAAANATATLGPMTGISFGLLRIDALTTATVNVQGSFDNITWSPLGVANIGQAPTTNPLTAVGSYGVSGASGFPYLRVIQNGAGSATVFLRATGASGTKFVWSLLADGFKVQSNGAATTTAPTYTTGTTNPLSLNVAGGLRVDGSAVTQPVSIATMPSTPVTGTFFQGTQPVSGTFFQGTQPVSIATMPSTPVTGTFFQGTQPVSIAALPALTAGAAVIGAVTQSGTWNIGTVTTLPALVAGTAIVGKVGIDQTTPGTTNLVSIGTNGVVSLSAPSTTYSASVSGLVPAALATDIFTITGTATKTVRITRIVVNGVQTTAGQVSISIVKRSTADTAGTSTAPTRIPYDSTSAAATATVLAYTANPTLGTTVGSITNSRLFVPGAATTSDAQGLEVKSGDLGQQFITLRGVAEVIAVNFNGVTIAGGAVNVTVEWTES